MPTRPPANVPSQLRIGAVNYLNSKPLVYRLEELARPARVLYDLPSRLADSLAAGRIDVGLIPVVEYFGQPGYQIVSDACVASAGPVQSVKLYFRKAPATVRSLALDEGSRTSAALGRILLERRFGLRPELCALPIGAGAESVDADAVLLIGDRAMLPQREDFVDVWDLGQEWRRWTGLPFVFACWAARPEVAVESIAPALAAARDAGVSRLPQIAAAEAAKLGLTTKDATDYLTNNLHFQLGPAERKALALFQSECERIGLLAEHQSTC